LLEVVLSSFRDSSVSALARCFLGDARAAEFLQKQIPNDNGLFTSNDFFSLSGVEKVVNSRIALVECRNFFFKSPGSATARYAEFPNNVASFSKSQTTLSRSSRESWF